MFDQQLLHRTYDAGDRERSWLRMNFVASLDGAATIEGLSGGLNDEWDLQVFQTLRAHADVVVVGAGTTRAEGYDGVALPEELAAWRRSAGLPAQPRLAIVTASGNLDPHSPVFAGSPPVLVFATAAADLRKLDALTEVAEVIVCGHELLDAPGMIAELTGRGMPQILCEGGPHLFGSLLEADVVDELCLTISPVLVGGTSTRIAVTATEVSRRMELVHALPGGPMLFLRYRRGQDL